MNIPKKADAAEASDTDKYGLPDENVLRELQQLVKVLSDRAGKPEDKKNAILVARLVEGITQEEWIALSQQHDLRSWLALPLADDAAEAVSSLRETLDQLVFQRDHDPLTGLANRRYFERFLQTEMERAARTNSALSLIMLDLDHFKRINDSYGHLCGDKVLQKLGSFLLRSQRSYDLAARYGGEEFTIILPGISFSRAKVMAQRLLGQFSEIEFKCDAHSLFSMTFSAGVAGVSPKTGYNYTQEQFIKMADDALYAAKRKGRNRVEMSERTVQAVADTMVMAEEKQFLFKNPE